jgi:hypothetical protein
MSSFEDRPLLATMRLVSRRLAYQAESAKGRGGLIVEKAK